MSARIPVLRPQLPDADRLLPYLRRIDASRIYTNWGPLTEELESRLAGHFGLPPGSVVSASSGTAALAGAIAATAGRATPDRPIAIVPALTFVATPIAAEQCGYRPYVTDVDARSWLLDIGRLNDSALLNDVGVVLVSSPFGRPVPHEACSAFQERTGIPVVIDGGASFDALSADPGRHTGDVPVALSFHATKSFSTAEGGCVVTVDTALAHRVVQALNFGFHSSRECASPSTNGKMSEYHAAIGLAELDGWPDKHRALGDVAARYHTRFAAVGLANRFVGAPAIAGCYALFVASDAEESSRVQRHLDAAAIEFRLWYGHGILGHPYFRDVRHDRLDTTDRLAPTIIGLPVAPDLSSAAIDAIVSTVAAAVVKDIHEGRLEH